MSIIKIIEDIKAYTVEEILELFGIEYKRTGFESISVICPFHNDTSFGNLSIHPTDHYFRCFACGEKGDIINIVAAYEGLDNIESIKEISYRLGITDEGGTYKGTRRKRKILKGKKSIEKDDKLLDIAYRTILRRSFLSEEHKKHLIEERRITEEEIKERMYKTFTWDTEYEAAAVLQSIKKEGYKEEDLGRIPGFFYDDKKKAWLFNSNEGLVLPIKNNKEQIVALQLRINKEWAKYIWVSSAGKNKGSSPGTPIDVLKPKEAANNTIFITEGKFKSEAIVKTFNSYSLSIQGVGNWSGIEEIIKEIEEEKGKCSIIIAFDNDIWTNDGVMKQVKKLYEALIEIKEEELIQVISWKTNNKGIDDLLYNLNDNAFQYIYKVAAF